MYGVRTGKELERERDSEIAEFEKFYFRRNHREGIAEELQSKNVIDNEDCVKM